MRNVIAKLFHKSPFEALYKHMLKVKECSDLLKPLMETFISRNRELIDEQIKAISDLEHEADIIKDEIREHLPYHLFMSINRADILRFLHQEDAIADSAEDVARLIEMRETEVPSELKENLMELVNKVLETVDSLKRITSNIKLLSQSSFSKREEEKISNLIKDVDRKEFEADVIQQKATKNLFLLEGKIDPISVVILMKIVKELGSVADNAQNTGSQLRCIIAR
ncbi:MAG: TIGR00153 family protein [Candidatus Aerophobetes bacterium]|nr:TIGR00153 family protein [Candidatus Aerophobetes bacterium]